MSLSSTGRRFCVLTVGRSGSTSLMNFLAGFDDIALPGKDVDCIDNELLHPERIQGYAEYYAKCTARSIRSTGDLIDAFFTLHAEPYAGFKSMPNRHADLLEFVGRRDIRFITLLREDIASTVASFMVAMATGSWRRFGEPQPARWVFDPARDASRVLGNLSYVEQCHQVLRAIPNSIALTYEGLCNPAFTHPALDDFFERPVRIEHPRPPTQGRSYVENWDEFDAFVRQALRSSANS